VLFSQSGMCLVEIFLSSKFHYCVGTKLEEPDEKEVEAH
jgi:hypothetical protein